MEIHNKTKLGIFFTKYALSFIVAVVPKDRTSSGSNPSYSNGSNAFGPSQSLTLDSILPYLFILFLLTGGMMGFTARFHNFILLILKTIRCCIF